MNFATLTDAYKMEFVILFAGLSVPIDPESDDADVACNRIVALLDAWSALACECKCMVKMEDVYEWLFGCDM